LYPNGAQNVVDLLVLVKDTITYFEGATISCCYAYPKIQSLRDQCLEWANITEYNPQRQLLLAFVSSIDDYFFNGTRNIFALAYFLSPHGRIKIFCETHNVPFSDDLVEIIEYDEDEIIESMPADHPRQLNLLEPETDLPRTSQVPSSDPDNSNEGPPPKDSDSDDEDADAEDIMEVLTAKYSILNTDEPPESVQNLLEDTLGPWLKEQLQDLRLSFNNLFQISLFRRSQGIYCLS
jgi:hypothetical protein